MAAKMKKFDGIISAVHYAPDGQIQWVRAFQRHGFVFSDRMLVKREDLLAWLKAGKKIYTGERSYKMGNDFELGKPVRLVSQNGSDVIVVGDGSAQTDQLEGVPIL